MWTKGQDNEEAFDNNNGVKSCQVSEAVTADVFTTPGESAKP